MKKIILFSLFIFLTTLFAQEKKTSALFSNFKFGVQGGVNFNSIPTVGSSLRIQGKTNITSKINLIMSFGFSTIYNDKRFEVNTFRNVNIKPDNFYIHYTYDVAKLEYTVIPINAGLEYVFTTNKFSPFAFIEGGYNFNTVQEKVTKSSGGGYYATINEIPDKYKQPVPALHSESFWGLGLGTGIRIKLTSSIDMEFMYVFRYNDTIVNTNQFLFGFGF